MIHPSRECPEDSLFITVLTDDLQVGICRECWQVDTTHVTALQVALDFAHIMYQDFIVNEVTFEEMDVDDPQFLPPIALEGDAIKAWRVITATPFDETGEFWMMVFYLHHPGANEDDPGTYSWQVIQDTYDQCEVCDRYLVEKDGAMVCPDCQKPMLSQQA